MNSIDTNDVVRLIVRDDPAQSAIALDSLDQGVFPTSGVWIETEWVLRSGYDWSRQRIAMAFADLLKTGKLAVPSPDRLRWAVKRYTPGADWVDMLHLIDSAALERFLTFDPGLSTQAGSSPPIPVQLLS